MASKRKRPSPTSTSASTAAGDAQIARDVVDSHSVQLHRAQDALLGQFVGDALGTRYEFSAQTTATKAVEEDIRKGHGRLKVFGGGPFSLIPGQVTDDTELAMALARSLVRKGCYDVDDVAYSYYTWYRSPPFDIGNTTRKAFSGGSTKRGPFHEGILANSASGNESSLSNGCLMRVAPLGIAGSGWEVKKLVEVAKLDCRLTNPHPVAQDAVAAYVVALATVIRSGDVIGAFDAASSVSSTSEVKAILAQSRERFAEDRTPGGMGYLGIALQMAFHELLRTERSFEESLVKVVKFGGDTDTNGCICGALVGAAKGSIPEQWAKAVKTCKPKQRLKAYPWVDAADLNQVAAQLLDTKEP